MLICFQTLYKNAYFVSTNVLTTPENGHLSARMQSAFIWLVMQIVVSIRETKCLKYKSKYNSCGKEIITILVTKYEIYDVSQLIEVLEYPGIVMDLLEKLMKPKGELNYLSY